jgi:hypothetical protein
MIYFSAAPVRPDSVDPEQYSALKEFRDSLKARALFEEYESLAEFRTKFSRQLAQTIISRFPTGGPGTEHGPHDQHNFSVTLPSPPTPEPVPSMSPQARELLVEASLDTQGVVMSLQTLDGYHVQTNGQNFAKGDARSAAQWKSAVEELERLDLIEDRGGDREVFFVTDPGYRVSELLRQRELPSAPALQFVQWHSGESGYPTNVPGGSPSWISIRNAEVRSPQLAKNVSAQIEWINDARTTRLFVPEADWYLRRGAPGKRTSEGWSTSAEIDGGDEQSCVLLVTDAEGRLWVYKQGAQPVGVLDYGHWTANLLVTSDNAEGFEGSLGFTLTRSGLLTDLPKAFVMHRSVPPKLRRTNGA